MRTFMTWLAAIVLGVAIGAGSLWYMVTREQPGDVITNGVWRMNPLAGSAAADGYARLKIALSSILALNRSETLYFEATTDAEGGPLTAACEYRLEGLAPDARWWSVTAYGADDMLIPSESRRYSASAGSVETLSGGGVVIALTSDGSGPNAIATGNGRFILLLRLYQPSKSVAEAPESALLFSLVKGSCRA